MKEGDCTIAATVLSLSACTCLLSFCVLTFVFFFFSKTAIWIGMADLEYFWLHTHIARGEEGMGKMEAQDVDRTSKAVLVRIVSTMATKRRNIIDS